jgi:hypothetical protein
MRGAGGHGLVDGLEAAHVRHVAYLRPKKLEHTRKKKSEPKETKV